MNGAVRSANDEGRFGPGLGTHPVGQIVGAHQPEEAEEGTLSFTEDDGAPTDDGELGDFGGVVDALFLFGWSDREDACKKTGRRESLRCDGAVVGDVAAHFKTARDLLRMVTFDAAARGKIRRTAEDEVKLFVRLENMRVPKVPVANVEAILKAIPVNGFAGEADAFVLRFDGNEAGGLQTPRGHERDGADAAAEVKDVARGRGPRRAVPGSEDVVSGKSMAVFQLEEAEVTADGIKGFSGFDRRPLAARAGRDGAGFGPPAKIRIEPVHTRRLCGTAAEMKVLPARVKARPRMG